MKVATLPFLMFAFCALNAQSNSSSEPKQVDTSQVYTITQQPPTYPHKKNEDEVDAIFNFLGKNLNTHRPKEEKNTHGKVLLRFTVDIDGSVKDVTLKRSLSPWTDAEAIRLVKLLKFEPAEQDGKLVRVYYNMPIAF